MSVPRPGGDDVPVFRSLAAPGLEEDDLFAALQGLPVPSPLWGDGWPALRREGDRPWCDDDERRLRHERLMRKWGADGGPPPR